MLTAQGVPKNYVEAMRWYRLSADQGDATGQLELGVMYHNKHHQTMPKQQSGFVSLLLRAMQAREISSRSYIARGSLQTAQTLMDSNV